MDGFFRQNQPNIVLVHGDTTTTLAASLSSYYHKINNTHVQEGLCIENINSHWPEEINRKLTEGRLFAPTETARINLLNEDILPNLFMLLGIPLLTRLLNGKILHLIKITQLTGHLIKYVRFQRKY